MLEIEKVNESNIEEVKNVHLADEQVKFAGTSEEFISSASETIHLHAIKNNGAVVGFFKLDVAYSSDYEFCPKDGLGLRAFAIDINCQGQGLGTEAVKQMMKEYGLSGSGYEFFSGSEADCFDAFESAVANKEWACTGQCIW